jgi:hypothetical protein
MLIAPAEAGVFFLVVVAGLWFLVVGFLFFVSRFLWVGGSGIMVKGR